MRQLIFILLTIWTMSVCGQEYSFSKNFVNGKIILKDSAQLTGQLKWFPSQNEKLKFRESENADTKKYSPEDLIGFTTDTLKFVSLFDLEVYADHYALSGKTSKIKHIFGQLVDSGSFNIYLVLITGADVISGTIQTYPNFYFEKREGNNIVHAAYPFAIRMKEKRFEKAKDNLYVFFKDYPQIIEKIKAYKRQDDFFQIIEFMKAAN